MDTIVESFSYNASPVLYHKYHERYNLFLPFIWSHLCNYHDDMIKPEHIGLPFADEIFICVTRHRCV